MMPDLFLRPRNREGVSPLDRFDVTFGGIGRGVVEFVAVFSKRYSRTDGMADDIILDNPSFAPMRADQTDLPAVGGAQGVAA